MCYRFSTQKKGGIEKSEAYDHMHEHSNNHESLREDSKRQYASWYS
jgi:hypothetical protein